MGKLEGQENEKDISVLEQVGLLEHWDHKVLVLLPQKGQYFFEGMLEVYTSADDFMERVKKLPEGIKATYSEIPLLMAIDIVCKNDCNGMELYGLADEKIFLSKEDIMTLKSDADWILLLAQVKVRQAQKQKVTDLLEDKELYLLGDIPSILEYQEDFYNLDMQQEVGKSYPSVKLYISKERAEKHNVRSFCIHAYPFSALRERFAGHYGLHIEPEERYGVSLSPDEI